MMACVIRADANSHIGRGHLTRGCTFAKTWVSKGGLAVLLTVGQDSPVLSGKNLRVSAVTKSHPDPADLNLTLAELTRLRSELPHPPWLVLDGYHFDAAYHERIRCAGFRLMVIDDMAHLPRYNADVVMNQNPNASMLVYRADADTVFFLGTQYSFIREEFFRYKNRPRSIPAVAKRLLIAMGADPHYIVGPVLDAVQALGDEGLEATLVLSGGNLHRKSIERAVKACPVPIRIVQNSQNMPTLMANADIAISAGGITCWELAFMGVPTVLIPTADNQHGGVQAMRQLDAALTVFPPINPSTLAKILKQLIHDRSVRDSMSTIAQLVVDGCGAERVVRLISGDPSSKSPSAFKFRTAALDDSGLLWLWANDAQTRLNSFSHEAIPWSTHKAWFEQKHASSACRVWILEFHDVPVGQIRIEKSGENSAVISFSVAPGLRGKGLGTRLLQHGISAAFKEFGVGCIEGKTFQSNVASVKAFLKAGFERSEIIIDGEPCFLFTKRRWVEN